MSLKKTFKLFPTQHIAEPSHKKNSLKKVDLHQPTHTKKIHKALSKMTKVTVDKLDGSILKERKKPFKPHPDVIINHKKNDKK